MNNHERLILRTEAHAGINERELYDLSYQIALRRVEEVEGYSSTTASPEAAMLRATEERHPFS